MRQVRPTSTGLLANWPPAAHSQTLTTTKRKWTAIDFSWPVLNFSWEQVKFRRDFVIGHERLSRQRSRNRGLERRIVEWRVGRAPAHASSPNNINVGLENEKYLHPEIDSATHHRPIFTLSRM